MFRGWALALLSVPIAVVTWAGQTDAPDDRLDACMRIAEGSARLACFDREMQRRHAGEARSEVPAGVTPPAASGGKAQARETPAPLPARAPKEAREPPAPVVARVQRSIEHPDHRYTIVLEDGSVWEQVESAPGLYLRARDSVTISPGALGSFFLTNGRHQSVRVQPLP